jgi:hypothetical protein
MDTRVFRSSTWTAAGRAATPAARAHRRTVTAVAAFTAIFLALTARPAQAQYKPRPLDDPATGEKYHIEASFSWWNPTSDMSIASESLGIIGSTIDFKRDLALQDKTLPQLSVTLRPARRHKFRGELVPIKYTQSATLRRSIVFNGQLYPVNLPVNSSMDWKAFRMNYEYDFVTKNWGFVGFIMEAKYTDVRVDLDSPFVSEFAHARGPIPALGGIARVYVVPNISINGDVTAFKIPDSIDNRYRAHYVDVDIYGTINVNDYVGGQLGYRSLDLGYKLKNDIGSFTLKGLYFGAVVRY